MIDASYCALNEIEVLVGVANGKALPTPGMLSVVVAYRRETMLMARMVTRDGASGRVYARVPSFWRVCASETARREACEPVGGPWGILMG